MQRVRKENRIIEDIGYFVYVQYIQNNDRVD